MRRITLLSCLIMAACIERPQGQRPVHIEVDRSELRGVLMPNAPTPQHLVGARFDEGIELIGYDATPDPVPRGGFLKLTFYYRATENVADDWEIFVHLDDVARAADRTIGDHFPAQGRFRTFAWRKGDIIRDARSIQMPTDVASFEIWTGFFQGNNRLPVLNPGKGRTDGVNRELVGTIALH